MKFIALLYIIVLTLGINAQEYLVPLSVNSNISKSRSIKTGDIHNLFIYKFDTLSLPFLDDFSEDHFPKFDAEVTDPNVTPETYFRIEVLGIPEPMGTMYMLDTTFRFQYDTVTGFGFDSIVEVGKTALPDQLAGIFDIDNYPVNSQVQKVWPPYNIYDSLWNNTAIDDTVFFDINSVDVFQDSSTVYIVNSVPEDANVYWEDVNVYHNYTYAKNIQTLGVASFDGLDDNGYPYDFSSISTIGKADVLTSKPIDMSGLTANDSVYFSFLIEPAGYGEAPNSTDSLILEFWSPLTQDWTTVWSETGYSSEYFKMQLLRITNGLFFQNGFQFRFSSYGGLSGSLDVWHLDYVHLNSLRSFEDTITSDWAFSQPSASFIKEFTSMPWPHYEFAPEDNMITDYTAVTYNSAATSPLINPCEMNLYFGSNNLATVSYPVTTPNVPSKSFFDMDYTIPSSFWFDTIYADTCASFEVVSFIDNNGLAGTDIAENDTLRHTQYFCNYYSYDDGTAEGAYGLVATGAQLAYKFNLAPGLTDSIRAISIHFEPKQFDLSNKSFFLQIWDDYQGEPGDIIYTTDQTVPELYYPEYNLGIDGFFEYVLPENVAVSGTYYVGWKQSSATDRLNIGFDHNIDNGDKIFYKTSSNWTNTSFSGSLMMRPVFVSDRDYILSQREIEIEPTISLYPNPANDVIYISSEVDLLAVTIIDLQGRIVYQSSIPNNQISTSQLPEGVYLASVKTSDNQVIQKKFIISH